MDTQAPVVHGLQVLAFTAPGATLFPQYIGEVFIAFTEASCKFLKEVYGACLRPLQSLKGRKKEQETEEESPQPRKPKMGYPNNAPRT
jgi:hypothetical protein